MSPERVLTDVDGRELSLSNLDKVLYPAVGFTKGQVLDYYARIADVMVPHLRQRPTTLRRYPHGVEGMSFFEKHAPNKLPSWISTIEVPSKSGEHEPIEYIDVKDRPTLLWAANLAALELHVPLWHVAKGKTLPTPPDFMVFDLDPGPGTTIVECCRVAQWLGEFLDRETLYAKTSGSKGLQLYSSVSRTDWERQSEKAHEIAQAMEREHASDVVSTMRKTLRNDRVLIDWSQNNSSKTTVAAYSLRARPEPTVSTPVTWQEIDKCAKGGDPAPLVFEAGEVLRRVDKFGDLFAPLVRPKPRSAKG
ncbi:MAG: polymerase LigD, polymerase domain protein [Acidimicrobiaceae bacterium]|nr:polymerase LigD, polymerase domain protein [Acidimicrobiaceae bacterium]